MSNKYSWMRCFVFGCYGFITSTSGYGLDTAEFWFGLTLMVLVQILTHCEQNQIYQEKR